MRNTALIMMITVLSVAFLSAQTGQDSSYEQKLINLAKKYTKADSLDYITLAGKPAITFTDNHGENGYFLRSSDYSQVVGYNGITDLAVILDTSFVVKEVSIISSQDTPSFIRNIKRQRFLKQFANYQAGKKIKTVTGATISSRAIHKTIDEIVSSCKKSAENPE